MLDWLGIDEDEFRIAFSKSFGSRWKPFGNAATQVGGLTNARDGVQWNAAYDPRDGRQWVGVNLEGMQYDDWPVARLLEREMKSLSLPQLIGANPDLAGVTLLWRRDYWQANSRPRIEERNIAPTPVALGDLTPEGWRAALAEAFDCLDRSRKRRGRATQQVTLPNGESVKGEVSPHLMFRSVATQKVAWDPFFREAKARLQPLHDWASKRAAKPISF